MQSRKCVVLDTNSPEFRLLTFVNAVHCQAAKTEGRYPLKKSRPNAPASRVKAESKALGSSYCVCTEHLNTQGPSGDLAQLLPE